MDGNNPYGELCDGNVSDKIASSRVLVIGAGGIGCEILKNLVLSGFKYIRVIDLDTIEMSNLNRQFLFRREHIGQSKAIVAASVASTFGDDVVIEAEYANIMNPKFDLFFFKSFDIVFNALDNIKARQYVNSLCILANIILIEGGSTGILGQSYPIIAHETECYGCRPRGSDEGEKYAICTIRSTPEKIEHNIVWAKELYVLLFGDTTESMLFEEKDSIYMNKIIPSSSDIIRNDNKRLDFCIDLLEALFDTEIEKQLEIGSYTTIDQRPNPIGVRSLIDREGVIYGKYQSLSERYDDVWDLKGYTNILLHWLWQYYKEERTTKQIFDKDKHGDIGIVAAATNLRCYTFHIPAGTVLAIKKIAGNIIPALASTNAIVAGIQVLSGVKLLNLNTKKRSEQAKEMRYSYLLKVKNNKNRLLQSVTLMSPFSTCLTCSSQTHLIIVMDLKRASFRGFLEEIIRSQLKFEAPMISIGSNLIYEEPDEDEEEQKDYSELFRTILSDLPGGGIQHGSCVLVTDCVNNQHASVTIYHQVLDDILLKSEEGYIVLNPEIIHSIIRTRNEEEKKEENSESEESDDLQMTDEEDDSCMEVNMSVKRSHPSDDIHLNNVVKQK